MKTNENYPSRGAIQTKKNQIINNLNIRLLNYFCLLFIFFTDTNNSKHKDSTLIILKIYHDDLLIKSFVKSYPIYTIYIATLMNYANGILEMISNNINMNFK